MEAGAVSNATECEGGRGAVLLSTDQSVCQKKLVGGRRQLVRHRQRPTPHDNDDNHGPSKQDCVAGAAG